MGSCNGLLCLLDHNIFVYNPATSELKALPPASNVDNVCFGLDSKRNEFKVMRIRYLLIREPPVLQTDREVQVLRLNRAAEVYSLNSGCSWRKLINVVDNDDVPCSSTPSCAYANGVCFWCGFNDEKVVAFDVSDEVFQTTPLPDAISLAGNRLEYGRTLTVLNELVAMIVFPKKEEEEIFFDIWVLFEFGVKESWTRLVRIEGFFGLERPLGFWKYGQLFVESREGQLVLCDPFTQRVRNLYVDGIKGSLQVLDYMQSSVSIEEGNNS